MTILELKTYLRGKCSSKAVNRLFRVADEFATLDGFFKAPKSDILGVWKRLHPDQGEKNKKALLLGKGFWDSYDIARSAWIGDVREVVQAQAPEAPQAPERDWESVKLTFKDVSNLRDQMECYGMEEISLPDAIKTVELIRKWGRGDTVPPPKGKEQ